jgi:hypothetical protein
MCLVFCRAEQQATMVVLIRLRRQKNVVFGLGGVKVSPVESYIMVIEPQQGSTHTSLLGVAHG